MGRREAVQLLLWALMALPMDGEEHERTARAVAQPRRVDARVIAHLDAMLAELKRTEDRRGPWVVARRAVILADVIEDLLSDCPAQWRAPLLVSLAATCASIAYYCLDFGDLLGAEHYCHLARKAAHEADNPTLGVYALCTRVFCAVDAAQPYVVRDAAAAASSLVRACPDPYMRVFVADKVAARHAVWGEYLACMRACDRADRELDRVSGWGQWTPGGWLTRGGMASKRGGYALLLGRPTDAIAAATTALDAIEPAMLGSRAFALARLGEGYLAARQLDEATDALSRAANLAQDHRSRRLLLALKTCRSAMDPWQDTPEVRTLDQRLSLVLPPLTPRADHQTSSAIK